MNRLKELREERGYTTRALEIKTNINHVSINYYENEKRDMGTSILKQLADFFEVTIDYLLCHSNCYVYASYKDEPFTFKIRDNFYSDLVNKGFIVFENDKRKIKLNELIGVNEENNLLPLIIELERIKKMDSLFDKKNPTIDDIDFDDITDIEINNNFIKRIKDAIN